MKRKLLGFLGRVLLTLALLLGFTATFPATAHTLSALLSQSAASLALLLLAVLVVRETGLRAWSEHVQLRGIGKKSAAQVRIREQKQ